MLELSRGNRNAESADLALRLLREEERNGGGRCCWYSAGEDMFRLHRARGDEAARASALAGDPRENERSDAFDEALREFRRAERLAPPHEAPSRFRRLARSWLALWRNADAFSPHGHDADEYWPAHARYAAYLQHDLAELERIAAGDPR